MTEIILKDGDRVEWAVKAFRRKVQRSGILKDLRKKRFYLKPSAARRKKAEAAARRLKRAVQKRRRSPA